MGSSLACRTNDSGSVAEQHGNIAISLVNVAADDTSTDHQDISHRASGDEGVGDGRGHTIHEASATRA